VRGRDIETGLPKSIRVNESEIRETLASVIIMVGLTGNRFSIRKKADPTHLRGANQKVKVWKKLQQLFPYFRSVYYARGYTCDTTCSHGGIHSCVSQYGSTFCVICHR
jgi:hypothetical protein